MLKITKDGYKTSKRDSSHKKNFKNLRRSKFWTSSLNSTNSKDSTKVLRLIFKGARKSKTKAIKNGSRIKL